MIAYNHTTSTLCSGSTETLKEEHRTSFSRHSLHNRDTALTNMLLKCSKQGLAASCHGRERKLVMVSSACGRTAVTRPRSAAAAARQIAATMSAPAGAAPRAAAANAHRRRSTVRVAAAAAPLPAAEPGKTTLGFVGIGIMGLAMVRERWLWWGCDELCAAGLGCVVRPAASISRTAHPAAVDSQPSETPPPLELHNRPTTSSRRGTASSFGTAAPTSARRSRRLVPRCAAALFGGKVQAASFVGGTWWEQAGPRARCAAPLAS